MDLMKTLNLSLALGTKKAKTVGTERRGSTLFFQEPDGVTGKFDLVEHRGQNRAQRRTRKRAGYNAPAASNNPIERNR